MASTTNFATALKTHSQTYAPGPKGATEVTTAGMSSTGNFVKDIEGAIVALNTSLVRGNKSTTEDIGVDRSTIEKLVENVLHQCTNVDMPTREQYLRDLFSLVFQKRAIRAGFGGGERTLSFWLLIALYDSFPKTVTELLKQVPEYGSWQDFKSIYRIVHRENRFHSNDIKAILEREWANQIMLDWHTYQVKGTSASDNEDRTISLVAKWIPKNGSSLDKETGVSRKIANLCWGGDPHWIQASKSKNYRKIYTTLNGVINTTERLMASRQFDKINFRLVPGRCLNKFHRVWMDEDKSGARRHEGDPVREMCRKNYQEFLKAVAEGKATAKGKSMFVHEIANEIIQCGNLERWKLENPERYTLLNAQFGDHVTAIQESCEGESTGVSDTVFLADVSGSMGGDPMGCAISVSVIGSSLANGPYKNLVLSFESESRVVDLSYPKTPAAFNSFPGYGKRAFPLGTHFNPARVGKELDWVEKIYVLGKSGWGGSTNFISALDKIVTVAQTYSVPMPKRIICITDMCWDSADRGYTQTATTEFTRKLSKHKSGSYKTLLGSIKDVLHQMNLELPEFIVWNARGRNQYEPVGYAAQAHDDKIKMISGFNVSMLKLFLTTGDLVEPASPGDTNAGDSYELIKKMFDHEDYDKIREIVDTVGEVSGKDTAPTPSVAWAAPSFSEVVKGAASTGLERPQLTRSQNIQAPSSASVDIDSLVDNMSTQDMKQLLQKLMDKM
jgi:hypothetical protein